MAAELITVDLDLGNNQLIKAKAEVLSADPATPQQGRFYANSTTGTLAFYTGSAWAYLGRLDQLNAPTASLNLNSQKITNLLDPTAAQDGATKAYIDGRKITDFTAPTTALNMNNQKISSLADPTAAQDAATKNYVDMAVQGLDVKASARVASVADVVIATAPAAIDGVTLANGDRVLLKAQTAGAQNGIYVFASAGSAMTRATDFDTWTELPGAFTFIEEGTTNAGRGYVCTNTRTGTIGTTAITFAQFSGAGSYSITFLGTGLQVLSQSGNVFNLKGIKANSTKVAVTSDANDIFVDVVPSVIAADAAFSAFAKRYTSGALTFTTTAGSVTVTHNLNVDYPQVEVFDSATKNKIRCAVQSTGLNTISLSWNALGTAITAYAVVEG